MNKKQQAQLQQQLQEIKQLYEETLAVSKKDPEFYASIKERLADMRSLLLKCHIRYKEVIDPPSQQNGDRNPCEGYDAVKLTKDMKTVYAVYAAYKDHPNFNLSYEEFQALNRHLLDSKYYEVGDWVCLPKGILKIGGITPSKSTKGDIAGDSKGSKTVLVTWTFDDGPVPVSKSFEQELNIDHATWFIVRANMHKVDGWDANVQHYLRCQQEGGSIGIHAQHPTYDHILWFPDHTHPSKYKAYASTEAAMDDMDAFYKELTNEKIYPKFVRPPGGLASQLQGYARHLGFVGDEPRLVRNALINNKGIDAAGIKNPETKGRDGKSLRVHFSKMKKDLNTMQSRLKRLGLKLWGGTIDPNQLKAQSWNAASAGTLGMTDGVTKEVSHADQRKEKWIKEQIRKGSKKTRKELVKAAQTWLDSYTGKFEKLVDNMKAGDEKPFIILAHDTSPHIDEIFQDKKVMEDYAARNDTKIVYLNMNELFDRIAKK